MIARIWHGTVPVAKQSGYEAFLEREVLPELREAAGNRGVTVVRRPDGEFACFLVISYWESEDALRALVGDDVERAHYRPAALEFLHEPAPYATHYEVLGGSDVPRR